MAYTDTYAKNLLQVKQDTRETMSIADEWNYLLTDRQKYQILSDLKWGAKYNIGYTLAAINWEESQGCEFIFSKGGGVGCYHQHVDYYLTDHKLSSNYRIWSKTHEMLLRRGGGRSAAKWKIEALYAKYGNWWYVWGAYNGTSNFKTGRYQNKIATKVKFLKTLKSK